MTGGTRNDAPIVQNSVVHNTLTYPGSTVIKNRIGGLDSSTPPTLYDPANHNYFDYNTYHFSSPALLTLKNWMWNGTPVNQLTWSSWQAAGEDPNGTAN
jgi:hypothetical protein